MDEAAVEKRGVDAAAARTSTAIAALKSKAELRRAARRSCTSTPATAACSSASAPARTSPTATRVIAFADAGGLGLPDRDYYLKDDAKSKEMREKYVGARGAACSRCSATPPDAREGARPTR